MILRCVLFLALLSPGVALMQSCSKTLTDEEILQSATLHYRNDEYDDALSNFQLLIKTYPKSDKVPEALLAMGVIYQNKKKEFRKAESLFTKLVMNFPDDPTAQSAAYERARILVWNLHQPDSARAAYEFFLHHYPDATSAPSARLELDSLNASTHHKK
jgi:TolA-binding protein